MLLDNDKNLEMAERFITELTKSEQTKIVITGADLDELSDCDNAVQDLLGLDSVERVEITFKTGYKNVYDAINSHIASWGGVGTKQEEKDGVTTISFSWTEQTRKAASVVATGIDTLAEAGGRKLEPPLLMPKP
jgi:hypothetical protein